MNRQTREELLSAYLDDELSADERANVEVWLAEDAAYRQLLDDLRVVRSEIQALARHKLDHDLTGEVLRHAGKVSLPASSSAIRSWWQRGNWRMVVWPAIAVAAALFIALFDSGRPGGERQVAQDAQREIGMNIAAKRSDGAASLPEREAINGQPAAAAAPAEGDSKVTDSERRVQDRTRPMAAPVPAHAAPEPGAVSRGASSPAIAPADAKTELIAAAKAIVICDVTAAFIDQRVLEGLLKENNMDWEQVRFKPTQDQSFALPETDKAAAAGERYLVRATPEELTNIVSELNARKDSVVRVESRRQVAESLKVDAYARRSPANDEAAKNVAQPARQPVIFWLRTVGGEQAPREKR